MKMRQSEDDTIGPNQKHNVVHKAKNVVYNRKLAIAMTQVRKDTEKKKNHLLNHLLPIPRPLPSLKLYQIKDNLTIRTQYSI